jgi:hypothetical protein
MEKEPRREYQGKKTQRLDIEIGRQREKKEFNMTPSQAVFKFLTESLNVRTMTPQGLREYSRFAAGFIRESIEKKSELKSD